MKATTGERDTRTGRAPARALRRAARFVACTLAAAAAATGAAASSASTACASARATIASERGGGGAAAAKPIASASVSMSVNGVDRR